MEAEELFKARSLQVLQQNRFMDRVSAYSLSGIIAVCSGRLLTVVGSIN